MCKHDFYLTLGLRFENEREANWEEAEDNTEDSSGSTFSQTAKCAQSSKNTAGRPVTSVLLLLSAVGLSPPRGSEPGGGAAVCGLKRSGCFADCLLLMTRGLSHPPPIYKMRGSAGAFESILLTKRAVLSLTPDDIRYKCARSGLWGPPSEVS